MFLEQSQWWSSWQSGSLQLGGTFQSFDGRESSIQDDPIDLTGIPVQQRQYPTAFMPSSRWCAVIAIHHFSHRWWLPSMISTSHLAPRGVLKSCSGVIQLDVVECCPLLKNQHSYLECTNEVTSLVDDHASRSRSAHHQAHTDELAQFLRLVAVSDKTNCCFSLVEHSYIQFNLVLYQFTYSVVSALLYCLYLCCCTISANKDSYNNRR